MSKEDWDPALGMTESQREGKSGKKDLAIAIGSILLIVVGLPVALITIANRAYQSDKDPETASLERLIKNVGTKIVEREDCEKGVQGYYLWDKAKNIDEIVVCNNNYFGNKPTSNEYWSLLAHEATHVMQACLGTKIYGSYQIKDMSYELMDKDEVSYRTIHGAYVQREEDYEIEARWMSLQPKRFVIDELRKHCMERPQDQQF